MRERGYSFHPKGGWKKNRISRTLLALVRLILSLACAASLNDKMLARRCVRPSRLWAVFEYKFDFERRIKHVGYTDIVHTSSGRRDAENGIDFTAGIIGLISGN